MWVILFVGIDFAKSVFALHGVHEHGKAVIGPRTRAVRWPSTLGYALEKSGVSLASFQGKRCPCGPKNGGMVAGAQELANWLGPKRFGGCPKPEAYAGKDVFSKIEGRTGIIFLANYWQRVGETGSTRTGDHIDLWNGSRMTAWSSLLRVHLGVAWDGVWSDFRGASKVLFWHIP